MAVSRLTKSAATTSACEVKLVYRNQVLLVAFALTGLFLASPATADMIVNLGAELDSYQEAPPHATPAYGEADATLDLTASVFSITGSATYADLLAGSITVRLQDAAVGMSGPTIASLTLDNPGTTSGTFSGSTAPLTPQQITDIMAGNAYLNITDAVFPSGEIRGQLAVVAPEPGSLALAAMAALGLLALARRRRTVAA